MKATSFFTDAEIELALALASEVLCCPQLSISWDGDNKLLELKDKIDVYYSDLNK